MNAYELVDKLEKHNWYKLTTKDDVIDMLIQQADHINELDILLDKKYAVIKQQADRIAELEKQTKRLSDEEITEIAEKTLGHSMGLLNWMGFARAIEERHGIK